MLSIITASIFRTLPTNGRFSTSYQGLISARVARYESGKSPPLPRMDIRKKEERIKTIVERCPLVEKLDYLSAIARVIDFNITINYALINLSYLIFKNFRRLEMHMYCNCFFLNRVTYLEHHAIDIHL